MNELEKAQYRIGMLESLISDAYDMAGQRGKGASIRVRQMLAHEAEKIKARRIEMNAQRTGADPT